MKRIIRFLCVFLFVCTISISTFSANAYAAPIDTNTGAKGYFTVNYSAAQNCKMKVGVTHKNGTVYYSYIPGTESSYTFTQGNGDYTVTLYRNVSGNSYAKVTSTNTVVQLESEFAPYLASTTEITFSKSDAVGETSDQLCSALTEDADKVVAIHNYIASHFTYDKEFAAKVRSGALKTYTPDTSSIIAANKGVCYDFSSLFAAMCRSQGIPCTVEKGMRYGGYHAWNTVYVNNAWYSVDLTVSISNELSNAKSLSDCAILL